MLKIKKNKLLAIIAILMLTGMSLSIFVYKNNKENLAVETLSKYGSRGSEVTQIQTKLKRWGYYSGSIDGIYGTQTVNAVKYFACTLYLLVKNIWLGFKFKLEAKSLFVFNAIFVIYNFLK